MDFDGLAQKAAKVADVNARNAAASREYFDARCDVVQALVDTVRPSLPFICAQIPNELSGDGGTGFSRVRGICIASGKIGRTTLGFDVYLREDASFLYVNGICERDRIPEGRVSQVQIDPVTLRDVVALFDGRDFSLFMEYATSSLDRAMDAQLHGKLEKRTVEFHEMAADLRALARLAAPRAHKSGT
jgi:hypothetical protein